MASKQDIIHFNGCFDAESREAFRAKRERHGLSRCELARLLGVEVVTIRRWECGPTVKVTAMAREIIETFLSGRIDGRLTGTASSERRIKVPKPILRRIENLASVYSLCAEYPEMQAELISSLKKLLGDLNRNCVSKGRKLHKS